VLEFLKLEAHHEIERAANQAKSAFSTGNPRPSPPPTLTGRLAEIRVNRLRIAANDIMEDKQIAMRWLKLMNLRRSSHHVSLLLTSPSFEESLGILKFKPLSVGTPA
jgi:hypothetical protein